MKTYDLRSDTLTRPTAAMRQAMASAEVGDDVYGEDPTVKQLEARTAELLGKESAMFVPSGTMANQIALLTHTQRGDEVIIGEGTHLAFFEGGAAAAWSGVQFAIVGRGGLFDANDVRSVLKPRTEHLPRTALVVVENTHNLGGGRLFPLALSEEIASVTRAHGLGLHMDGARLWHAAVATGLAPSALAAPFDTVSVCFSKGLGAPVGSALVGTVERLRAARRFRKMLGGAMRQSGVLAAAALYALDHHRERLAQDHLAARGFAERLSGLPNIEVPTPDTNIVLVRTPNKDAGELAKRAATEGVLIHAMGPHTLRAVTHMDIPESEVYEAAEVLRGLL